MDELPVGKASPGTTFAPWLNVKNGDVTAPVLA